MTVKLKDGTVLPEITVEYPIGHKRRRKEGIPLLEAKFRSNLARRFVDKRQRRILDVSLDQKRLESMTVNEYVDLYVS
jgi:2-methylcitrate dehydratase